MATTNLNIRTDKDVKEQANAALNRIGYQYMNFGTMRLFSCSTVLVHIQNYSKNDFGKYEFVGNK